MRRTQWQSGTFCGCSYDVVNRLLQIMGWCYSKSDHGVVSNADHGVLILESVLETNDIDALVCFVLHPAALLALEYWGFEPIMLIIGKKKKKKH